MEIEDEMYAFDSSGMYDPCICRKKIKCVLLTACVLVLFLLVVTTDLPYDNYDEKKSLNSENQFERIRIFVLELKDGICEWARTIFAMIMQTFAAFNDPLNNSTSTITMLEYTLNHSSPNSDKNTNNDYDEDEGVLPFLMTNDTGMSATIDYMVPNRTQEKKKKYQRNKKQKQLKKKKLHGKKTETIIEDFSVTRGNREETIATYSAKLPEISAPIYDPLDLIHKQEHGESLSYKHASMTESLSRLNEFDIMSKDISTETTLPQTQRINSHTPTQQPTQTQPLFLDPLDDIAKNVNGKFILDKPTAAPTQEPTQRLLSTRKSGTLLFESNEEKAKTNAALFSLLPTWLTLLFLVSILLLGCCFTLVVHGVAIHGYRRKEGTDLLYGIVFVPVIIYTCGRYCSNAIRTVAADFYQTTSIRITDRIDVAYEEILSIVRQHGGHVESTRESTGNLTAKREITITVKCPENDFEMLLEHVKDLFKRVNSRNECRAFVLVESSTKLNGDMLTSRERRRNLKQIEQRYSTLLKFMDKSETITEALAIQKELAQMEEQMEKLKQQNVLYEQAMLTITLTENSHRYNSTNCDLQVKKGHGGVSKMQSMKMGPEEDEVEVCNNQVLGSNGNGYRRCRDNETDIENGLDISTSFSPYGENIVEATRKNSDDRNGYKLRLGSVYIDARATVRIAIYDTASKTFREQTSGFVANKDLGLIVTCSHLIVDPTTLIEKYQVPVHGQEAETKFSDSRFLIVVGVLRDEREAPAWKFMAKVVVKGNKANHNTFVDALVLQLTGTVHSKPTTNELEMETLSQIHGHGKSVFKSVELHTSAVCTPHNMQSTNWTWSGLLPAMLPMGVSARLHVNDPVYFLGFPSFRGETICCDSAVINQLDQKYINCTAFQHAGSSGGPLINRHGEVIGIMSKGFRPGDFGQHLAIDWVYPLVKEAEEKCKY